MTTLVEDSERARCAAADTDAPRRAAGLQLLGRFDGSGLKEPPYLVRRSDGQVIQLSPLLYALGEAADGRRRHEAIADDVTARLGRRISPDNVRFLVERKLRPLGILAAADGSSPALERRQPILALRHRRPLVSARVVQRLAGAFKSLFWPPLVAAVVAALVVFDAWLFFSHGIAGGLRSAIYNPTLLLAIFGSVILATAFHEVGHAAACRYGGARPGAMGAGLYLVWPAFYCDVTDAYRLGRAGRVRTDLGGVYFNAVFALLAGALYFATGAEALLLPAVVQHFVIVQQLLPLLRFDGYYVLSDLTGVPDILSRIGPIFRSLLPWREPEPRVAELKPWVRVVVSAYVATLVPLVALLLTWLVLGAPRLFATIFDSLSMHADRAAAAAGGGEWPVAALGALQLIALLLPCAAVSLTFGRLARLLSGGVRRWAGESARRKAVVVACAGIAAGLIVASWWPDGDYQPLAHEERGTVGEVLSGPAGDPADRSAPAATVQAAVGSLPAVPAADGAIVERDDAVARGVGGAPDVQVPAPWRPDAGEDLPEPDDAAASAPTPEPVSAAPAAPPTTPGSPPAPEPTAAPAPPAGAEPASQENRAQAVNTTDGARVFELAFDIERVREGPVTHTNIAQAFASCEACRTIAIAVQVVLVMADVDYAVPVNYAAAINYDCSACQTLAFAWQLVFSTGGEVELTAEASERIAAIEMALAALEHSDASIAEIQAAADRLMDELRDAIATGLQPAGDPAAPARAGAGPAGDPAAAAPASQPEPTEDTDASSGAEPSPTASPGPSETPTPAAQDEPAPEETLGEEPTPTSTPDPTPTPEPTTTAAPAPTTTAEPTATPTP